MAKLKFIFFLLIPAFSFCQPRLDSLTIEKIMSDPEWIGTSPSNPFWNAVGSKLFFSWNPENAPSDSLYFITIQNKKPQRRLYQKSKTWQVLTV